MAHSPVSVLIVEDELSTRERLSEVIQANEKFVVIGSAANCNQARKIFSRCLPTVVIMDLGLPDGNGIELIKDFCQENTHILVLSKFDDAKYVLDAIRQGAEGYILKDALNQDVCSDILEMLDGGAPISPQIATHILKLIRPQKVTICSDVPKLSNREREVLVLVSKGYCYAEIAAILSLKYNTVASYIKTIYRKLDVSSGNEAVYEARQQGILDGFDSQVAS